MRCLIWSFFIPILVLVLISGHDQRAASSSSTSTTTTGGHLVRQTCRRAAQSNPFLNFDFCITSLEADPRSSSADLRGLGIIVTNLAEANGTETEKKIVALLARASDTQEKNRLEDCKDMYSDAFDDLKYAEEAFYSNKYRNANYFLSGALDNTVGCEDSWQPEYSAGQYSSGPLTAENYNMEQLCRMGLVISIFLSPHFVVI